MISPMFIATLKYIHKEHLCKCKSADSVLAPAVQNLDSTIRRVAISDDYSWSLNSCEVIFDYSDEV